MKTPLVTIAMPCLDEERYIEACLRSVLRQDYPTDRLEILIVDGGSRDRTRDIVARIAAQDARVILVDNPARLQAPGMNAAIRRARGDVIVRMDVHCEYARDYVRKCVEILERTGADNVGGAQRPRAETRFQRALCAALDSVLGVGGASYRSAHKEGFVDTVFLGAFRRRVFEDVGLFDPGAVTNEDAELNQRIRAAGGKVYLSREIVVHYYPRRSFSALAKQYYRYGRGRARTLLKHRGLPSLRPVLPAAFVVTGATLMATAAVQPFTPAFVGLYSVVTGVATVRVGRKLGMAHFPTIGAIFPVLHTAHGVGFISGLARYVFRKDWDEPERLPRPAQPRSAPQAAQHDGRRLEDDLGFGAYVAPEVIERRDVG